ncbi:hypothetical protein EV699_110184 [Plasticicumulans lactativorans]|uniref:Uncharacterized protein n=2 Tax=Plasticicumulans lactativorans TaxID=1133106 RepID=A0A4R2LAD3_9GAMM|nr:hypothetical protein EV699_110184 [Plasticicumulans lactativorans]
MGGGSEVGETVVTTPNAPNKIVRWNFGNIAQIKGVKCREITAGELAAMHRQIGGRAELADALDALPAGEIVYDVDDEDGIGTGSKAHVVYREDGSEVWSL